MTLAQFGPAAFRKKNVWIAMTFGNFLIDMRPNVVSLAGGTVIPTFAACREVLTAAGPQRTSNISSEAIHIDAWE